MILLCILKKCKYFTWILPLSTTQYIQHFERDQLFILLQRVEGEWSWQRVAGSRGGDKLALRFTLYYQLKWSHRSRKGPRFNAFRWEGFSILFSSLVFTLFSPPFKMKYLPDNVQRSCIFLFIHLNKSFSEKCHIFSLSCEYSGIFLLYLTVI